MAYNWAGMKKLSWAEVNDLARKGELVGIYKLYDDNTEAAIEADYTLEEIVEHYRNGGEFAVEYTSDTNEKLFILHGYWNTPDTDGVQIIKISNNFKVVELALRKIIESNACEFVNLLEENWSAVGGDRFYEITDDDGNYAKFYITEEMMNEYDWN